jgi:hypothetical protein
VALEFEMLFEERWFVWLNWLVAAVIAVAIVFFHGSWLTPNVYKRSRRSRGWGQPSLRGRLT